MKTISSLYARLKPGNCAPGKVGNGFNRFHLLAVMFVCAILLAAGASAPSNYTAHEWGTFTSVQGGDGELLPWRPLLTSQLPGFVYNWTNAGPNRGLWTLQKGALFTLQRMETPVIYFYADQPMNVDVDVSFPKGVITEWYPQATQIGPSYPLDTNGTISGILHESRAVWRNLQIVPESKDHVSTQNQLPKDSSGSHYFAARETSANMVRTDYSTGTNNVSEFEKFIFYRGAGSFKTPLHVTVDSNDVVTVENIGAQPLEHLFLVNIHNGIGSFGVMDELTANNSTTWMQASAESGEHWNRYPLQQFQSEIGRQMQTALVGEGLFPDEAAAMVNTWKDSWFTEDGVRIFYILPRAWTDETLPLGLNPRPKDLTRVMVGRAEIITPSAAEKLRGALGKASSGGADTRAAALSSIKAFGRFAEPAIALASNRGSLTNVAITGYQLLWRPAQSRFE